MGGIQAAERDGRLVRGWRYVLIFLGVSFNKTRAVHELNREEEAAVEAWKGRLRSLSDRLGEGASLEQAAASVAWPRGLRLCYSGGGGEIFAQWGGAPYVSVREKNMHRFPMAGQEYVEKVLKVPFDPDSEIRSLELGVPVRREGKIVGALGGEIPFQNLRDIST